MLFRSVARPAGRPGEKLEHGAALFSRKYGQSTAVCLFDRVFVAVVGGVAVGEVAGVFPLAGIKHPVHRHKYPVEQANGGALADFAVCCAVAIDAPGLTIVARPAGRPGEKLEHGAAKSASSTPMLRDGITSSSCT